MKNILGISSFGILRIPYLANFLDEFESIIRLNPFTRFTAVAGWGLKDTARSAYSYAKKKGIPYLALEDGFLRSLDLGINGAPPASMVVDDIGIYYDATGPSRLEDILQNDIHLSRLNNEASTLITHMLAASIGKYNAAPEADPDMLGLKDSPLVIVLDQTVNDKSVQYGLADVSNFRQALESAISENNDADVRIKIHPDVWTGKKKGYLADLASVYDVPIISSDLNWMSLLKYTTKVYTVTSHGGMEALLHRVPVTCFGVPYYSHWGLTDDRTTCVRRTRKLTLEELVAGVYLKYARYINPLDGRRCDALLVCRHLEKCKRLNDSNRTNNIVLNMDRWKKSHVRPFLYSTHGKTKFVYSKRYALKKACEPNSRLIVWGANGYPELDKIARERNIRLYRMEDGFLRSTGLGSDFIPASSLALDGSGIYYNPDTPSDLEKILLNTVFDNDLINRAKVLRKLIVEKGISKYNYGTTSMRKVDKLLTFTSVSRKSILVPGQVEDDQSIILGSPAIKTNLGLLKEVRNSNPDADIIYKPHPDVETGNRKGKISHCGARMYADVIISSTPITYLLDKVDEIHTLTSLTGFEALLRNKTVYTYGLPFYSGWGLTTDYLKLPRRSRSLNIDELVAGALLVYPLYYDWYSNQPCEPIDLVNKLFTHASTGKISGFERIYRLLICYLQQHRVRPVFRYMFK